MADTFDLLTLAEAKKALGWSEYDATRDDELASVVTAGSRKLDRLIGPTVQRSVTNEVHDGCRARRGRLRVDQWPVRSYTSVVEYQGVSAVTLSAESAGSQPTDAYLPERYQADSSLYSGALVRRTGGLDTSWWQGRSNVLVTYTPGRCDDTASVDERIKEGAKLLLRNMWRSHEISIGTLADDGGEYAVPRSTFPTFAMPRAVVELLHDLVQAEIGFGAP